MAATALRVPEIYAGNIAMFIALYTVGAWMNSRRAAFLVRAGIMVVMAAWLVIEMYRQAVEQAAKAHVAAGAFSPLVAFLMLQVLLNVLYFGGAYYFGERSWSAAAQRAVLEQRTAELERERELSAAQAVALDRVRIARELHDVVAHHVSVMGVQAGAARLMIPQDPQAATGIVAGIETAAREAIRDFHQLLDTLRAPGDSEDGASTVGVDDIAGLVAASSAAGLPARLHLVGDPIPVPRVTAVNLYRIAQEALTNARRHAGPDAEAEVRIRYGQGRDGRDAVELEVVNSGRIVPAVRPGLGQLGMRERAAASGGTIELVPRAAGGFRVRATLPVGPTAAALASPAADPDPGADRVTGPIRVLFVDDHALLRAGFRTILDLQPDIDLVGEAATGTEAVELAAIPPSRRHHDGRADAGHGRARGDPAHPRGRADPRRRRDRDDLRPRRLPVRGARRRGQRVPAEERRPGGADRGGPRPRRGRRHARP